jgi:excisionase family DNA binding protein
MSLAEPIITLLAHFQSAFTNPTWQKKRVLLVGILLDRGRLVLFAKKLGLSRTMVYILINREGLPVVRFGRAVRISAPSLQKWVEERERTSMSAASSY